MATPKTSMRLRSTSKEPKTHTTPRVKDDSKSPVSKSKKRVATPRSRSTKKSTSVGRNGEGDSPAPFTELTETDVMDMKVVELRSALKEVPDIPGITRLRKADLQQLLLKSIQKAKPNTNAKQAAREKQILEQEDDEDSNLENKVATSKKSLSTAKGRKNSTTKERVRTPFRKKTPKVTSKSSTRKARQPSLARNLADELEGNQDTSPKLRELSDFTVLELKNMLRENGLKLTGTKPELIARLAGFVQKKWETPQPVVDSEDDADLFATSNITSTSDEDVEVQRSAAPVVPSSENVAESGTRPLLAKSPPASTLLSSGRRPSVGPKSVVAVPVPQSQTNKPVARGRSPSISTLLAGRSPSSSKTPTLASPPTATQLSSKDTSDLSSETEPEITLPEPGSPAMHTRSHDLGSPAKHTRSHDKADRASKHTPARSSVSTKTPRTGPRSQVNSRPSGFKGRAARRLSVGPRSTKRLRSPSPTRSTRSRSPTRSAKSRSPTRSAKSRSPTRSAKSRSPTRSVKSRSPTRSPRSRSPTRSPRSRSPTRSVKSRSPTRSVKSRSPTRSVKSRSPTRSVKSRSPTRSTRSRSPTRSVNSRSPTRSTRSRSPVRTRSRSPTRTSSQNKNKPNEVTRSTATTRSRSPVNTRKRSSSRSSSHSSKTSEEHNNSAASTSKDSKRKPVLSRSRSPTNTTSSRRASAKSRTSTAERQRSPNSSQSPVRKSARLSKSDETGSEEKRRTGRSRVESVSSARSSASEQGDAIGSSQRSDFAIVPARHTIAAESTRTSPSATSIVNQFAVEQMVQHGDTDTVKVTTKVLATETLTSVNVAENEGTTMEAVTVSRKRTRSTEEVSEVTVEKVDQHENQTKRVRTAVDAHVPSTQGPNTIAAKPRPFSGTGKFSMEAPQPVVELEPLMKHLTSSPVKDDELLVFLAVLQSHVSRYDIGTLPSLKEMIAATELKVWGPVKQLTTAVATPKPVPVKHVGGTSAAAAREEFTSPETVEKSKVVQPNSSNIRSTPAAPSSVFESHKKVRSNADVFGRTFLYNSGNASKLPSPPKFGSKSASGGNGAEFVNSATKQPPSSSTKVGASGGRSVAERILETINRPDSEENGSARNGPDLHQKRLLTSFNMEEVYGSKKSARRQVQGGIDRIVDPQFVFSPSSDKLQSKNNLMQSIAKEVKDSPLMAKFEFAN